MTENDTPIMNNNDDKFDELLARWLSDDLTEAELQALEAEEGQETLAKLRQVAEASAQLAPPPLDHDASWSRLAAAMEEEEDAETVPFTPTVDNNPSPKGRRWGLYGLGAGIVAAVAILLLFILPGNQHMTEITARGTEKIAHILPDGSRAILKPGAFISYAKDNWSSTRALELKGEAYFQVSKGSQFRVKGAMGDVTVLGTRFMVKQVDDGMEVACYNGKVKVFDRGGKELAVLTKGDAAQVGLTKFQKNTHQDEAPEWAIQDFRFENTPLKEVIKSLEQEFDIELSCNSCEEKRFTGAFSNRKLAHALDQVFLPFGMVWENIEGRGYKIQ